MSSLSQRDIKDLEWAVLHILDDSEWEGCPQIETRVRLYVTSLFRLGRRWKLETTEAKILEAEPYLLAMVKQAQSEQQNSTK